MGGDTRPPKAGDLTSGRGRTSSRPALGLDGGDSYRPTMENDVLKDAELRNAGGMLCLMGAGGDARGPGKSIRRVDVLRLMEEREGAASEGRGGSVVRRRLYSIQFCKKNGEVVYFPHAFTCGLTADMKRNRLRGVQPCDCHGQRTGHVVAVSIDNIREFDGMRVKM